MNRRSPVHVLCALLLCLGCESTPRPKEAVTAGPPAGAVHGLDAAALIQTVQTLRDREFVVPPTLEAAGAFEPGEFATCAGRCDEERRWLTRVLFAGQGPVVPPPLASWDASRNVVVWDRTAADETAARAAVLAELVRALDGLRVAPAVTWDGYLASCALVRGAGVFVATLDLARRRADRIDAKGLAMRPESLYALDVGANRFADSFAAREGYAFVAALIRSGGWSAVELAHSERPTTSLQIVRPDKYLAGDQAGEWAFPAEVGASRSARGFDEVLRGEIGPALFVEWLSRRVPAGVARAGYIGFESDHYRVYAHADGRWSFDWVSLWNTPSTAQQVVEALDAGLQKRDDGARFSVLRKGATVAVVGQSQGDEDLLDIGTLLVDTSPVFPQPAPRGVAFVPTPVDRLQARPQVTAINPGDWTDEATGLSLDLGALGTGWQVLPTTEPNLPWFAKHRDGAVVQYLVEPLALFDPPFGDDAYLELVRGRFAATMVPERAATVTRTDKPVQGTLLIDALGKIKDRNAEGPVHLMAWQFSNGGFVTTLSLQAPPAQFATIAPQLDQLLGSIDVGTQAATGEPGVIRFEVED